MTEQELLAALDEEIGRLQNLRAALQSESLGYATHPQGSDQKQLVEDHSAAVSQKIAGHSSVGLADDLRLPATPKKREAGARWSLY